MSITLRRLTKNDVVFTLKVEPEDLPPEGNVLVSGDDEQDAEAVKDVTDRLNAGNIWAWCQVTILANWSGFCGKEVLGCCSYTNQEEFIQGDYYAPMLDEALADLNRTLASTLKTLSALIVVAHGAR